MAMFIFSSKCSNFLRESETVGEENIVCYGFGTYFFPLTSFVIGHQDVESGHTVLNYYYIVRDSYRNLRYRDLCLATKFMKLFLVNDQRDVDILSYVFIPIYNSLHVSSTPCSSSGEENCINTASGNSHSMLMAEMCAGWNPICLS
jgi:hypothetical protein